MDGWMDGWKISYRKVVPESDPILAQNVVSGIGGWRHSSDTLFSSNFSYIVKSQLPFSRKRDNS